MSIDFRPSGLLLGDRIQQRKRRMICRAERQFATSQLEYAAILPVE
jgi:hypothetical protein